MASIFSLEAKFRASLTYLGFFVSLLVLRLMLGYEFWEAGVEKFNGDNWFASLEGKFPFPFSLVPTDISWFLATWLELIGALLLFLGLATRYAAISLFVLTIVAIGAAHMPEAKIEGEWVQVGIGSWADFINGFRISQQCEAGECSGNYKLPVIYLFMFIPLIFSGAGKLSLDHLVAKKVSNDKKDSSIAD